MITAGQKDIIPNQELKNAHWILSFCPVGFSFTIQIIFIRAAC
jgi:hypothetical protein